MSEAIKHLCWPLPMSVHAKAVLMCLAHFADDTQGVVPAPQSNLFAICRWTCLKPAEAQHALFFLANRRLIVQEQHGGLRMNVAQLAIALAGCRAPDPADGIE